MTDEVVGHAELKALDVIGDTGDMARAVPQEIAGVAVGAGPWQEAGGVGMFDRTIAFGRRLEMLRDIVIHVVDLIGADDHTPGPLQRSRGLSVVTQHCRRNTLGAR
ncbi:hypothetical protein NCG97_15415 [Streptomyces lydicamycinicus]|uniref:hypothetical protein n=1 Tax=Streptomyces lydicamycinicus TaxID=1546107 RepID=UPI0020350274|nr:hypothetical protein [Streptomyces lydicamycinicus]USA01749.1 hypothetical protein NCG97_15415 [Streptomyces lydicamycinicus]